MMTIETEFPGVKDNYDNVTLEELQLGHEQPPASTPSLSLAGKKPLKARIQKCCSIIMITRRALQTIRQAQIVNMIMPV